MNHSSKGDPCPLCGRDKDDKCRWNEKFLFCYRGDSHSPPELAIGETVRIAGWPLLAVVGDQGGFAGSSLILAPDDGSAPLQPLRVAADGLANSLAAAGLMRKIRLAVREVNACLDFCFMNIDQLRHYAKISTEAQAMTNDLESFLRLKRGSISRWRQLNLNVKDSRKQLNYFLKDLSFFIENNLGCSFKND